MIYVFAQGLTVMMMVLCIPVMLTITIYFTEFGTKHAVCMIPGGSDACDISISKYKLIYEKILYHVQSARLLLTTRQAPVTMKIKRNDGSCKYDGPTPDFIKLYYVSPDPFLVEFEPYGYHYDYIISTVTIFIAFLIFGVISGVCRKLYFLELKKPNLHDTFTSFNQQYIFSTKKFALRMKLCHSQSIRRFRINSL